MSVERKTREWSINNIKSGAGCSMQSTDICAVTFPLCPHSLAWREKSFTVQPFQPCLLSPPSLLSGKRLLMLEDPAEMSPSLWNSPNSLRQHESFLLLALQAECTVSSTIHHVISCSSLYTPISPTGCEFLQDKDCLIHSCFPVPHSVLATISCGCSMRIL